uniref:DNA 3'-5' helicase n=1 Tax=Amphimedon queenslandica TaxID=400682 RepID=A0A1X7U944_AMPQE
MLKSQNWEQQVLSCQNCRVTAGYICGESDDYVKDFVDGKLQLVHFTPELLLKSRSCTIDSLKTQIISFTQQSCLRIVCATIAFGMGINCLDVRSVVHMGPPDDLKSYIQETGLAGRDILPSTAIFIVKKRFGRVYLRSHPSSTEALLHSQSMNFLELNLANHGL